MEQNFMLVVNYKDGYKKVEWSPELKLAMGAAIVYMEDPDFQAAEIWDRGCNCIFKYEI